MEKKYYTTIGLEIHAELKTASKMFCSCKNDPDEEKPNANVCSVCLGHPGTLPVLNKEAIRHVLRMGIAVNGEIADFTEWDRKNYFYPDIPKGYQISQFKYPLVSGGTLGGVEIERIHLEEDTAQSTHDSLHAAHKDLSLVNFNRSGVPLMELVTKPVIHDAVTAVRFAKELQLLLRYLGAGDANMEKGEMRVEANISVSPTPGVFGTKTEVKNLNSFRSVEGAIAYEVTRQIDLIESGGAVVQETRGWDDAGQKTFSQRKKEGSHDYRYFPEPDIPKLKISEIPEFASSQLKKTLPELPWAKRERYKKDYGMTDKEVAVFVDSPATALYFESVITSFKGDSKKIKLAINYILSDYLGILKKAGLISENGSVASGTNPIETIPSASFTSLIEMISAGDLSSRGAKDLLAILFTEKGAATSSAGGATTVKELADKHGLIQKSDSGTLLPIIEKVLADNAKAIAEYKAGKAASLQFLIGQTMKAGKGANPEMVKSLILEKIA